MCRERERNVLFNDALNTFYLRLYGVRHMVICVFIRSFMCSFNNSYPYQCSTQSESETHPRHAPCGCLSWTFPTPIQPLMKMWWNRRWIIKYKNRPSVPLSVHPSIHPFIQRLCPLNSTLFISFILYRFIISSILLVQYSFVCPFIHYIAFGLRMPIWFRYRNKHASQGHQYKQFQPMKWHVTSAVFDRVSQ